MIRTLSSLLIAFGLIAYMPLGASARGGHHGHGGLHRGHHGHGFHRGSSDEVPELDPNSAAAALTLLAGGALALGGRRRRQAF